jgi:hypothetical protein
MPRNVFDQAGRFAAQLDPAGFVAWALRVPPDAVRFRGWLDTRGVPFPGDPDHTGDTVARLDDPAGGQPWAVAVEFQIEPDPLMFGRLLGYLSGVRLARKPDPERGSRFHLGAAVLNLTGTGTASREMRWPAAGLVTHLGAAERNLAAESAGELLGAIETRTRPRGLLPWAPLMTGGDDPGIIDRWKAAAEAEPDDRRRSDYAGLALVFADAADRKPAWKLALKEWNMKRSSVVDEWKAEGETRGRIAAVLEALEARFTVVPPELADAVRGTADLDTLRRWTTAAALATSLDDFRTRAGL